MEGEWSGPVMRESDDEQQTLGDGDLERGRDRGLVGGHVDRHGAGGSGDDIIFGAGEDDSLSGDDGDDTIEGGAGDRLAATEDTDPEDRGLAAEVDDVLAVREATLRFTPEGAPSAKGVL